MIRQKLRRQEGSALVTAMLVMMLCLMVGFTALAMVDVQQGQSRGERERESSFALGEGALTAQVFMLSRGWPHSASLAYSTDCTEASVGGRCPDPATLANSFSGADYDAGQDWSTAVHDNAPGIAEDEESQQFYDDAVVRQQPGWDRNDDGLMWVRAQAVIRGRTRTLVALIRAEKIETQFPRNALVANQLIVTNAGNKTHAYTGGSYVILRCNGAGGTPLPPDVCKDWDRPNNVGPNAPVNVVPDQRPALSPEVIEMKREEAMANGTYHETGCPSLAGAVVFIERANCNYTGNDVWNSQDVPGMLIIGSGYLEMQGTTRYYGVIYHVNGSDGKNPQLSGTVLKMHGNNCTTGSVVVDGPGGVEVGSSGHACDAPGDGNLTFDGDAAENIRVYGTAGIVQNSFREIVPTT
jgi:hypothetical protein